MKPYPLTSHTWGLFLFAFFSFLASPSAEAGQGDITLQGEIDYHLLFDVETQSGVGLGFEASYGLSDTLGLVTQLKGAFIFGGEEPDSTRFLASAGVGISLALDVLRAVPLVTVLPSIYHIESLDGESSLAVGLQAGLALDYLLTRRATVGLLLGGYQYRADPVSGLDQRPDSFTAGVRGGLIFSP